jgi:hypothetical protein
MLSRCYNKNAAHYKDYGGRGIAVHEPWHKYENFRDYMLDLPDCPENVEVPGAFLKRTIDRIRNFEGYMPGNVRWATATEQANNKRNNKYHDVTVNGQKVSMTLRELVDRFGKVSYATAFSRLNSGKSLKAAVTDPLQTVSKRR